MAAAEKDVQEKRGENHRLTAHDAWGWPWCPVGQRPAWFFRRLGFPGGLVFREARVLGSRFTPVGGWESRQMTAGAKQELLNNKP
jgi:hypothetical protein